MSRAIKATKTRAWLTGGNYLFSIGIHGIFHSDFWFFFVLNSSKSEINRFVYFSSFGNISARNEKISLAEEPRKEEKEFTKTNFSVIDFIENYYRVEDFLLFDPCHMMLRIWARVRADEFLGLLVYISSRKIMLKTNGDWNNDDEVFKWPLPFQGREKAMEGGKLAQNRFHRGGSN